MNLGQGQELDSKSRFLVKGRKKDATKNLSKSATHLPSPYYCLLEAWSVDPKLSALKNNDQYLNRNDKEIPFISKVLFFILLSKFF